ncbi:MAG: HIRAN domain-containing protein [Clostridiales bacterium]|jgi:hypothetical protein|nr:HIRAN domain-containing protein [Clostridiales bacterium]
MIFDIEPFTVGKRTAFQYYPDLLLEDDSVVEIKGFWNFESVEKVRRFKLKYPEIKLYIIDGDMYYTISKIFGDKIPEWEGSKASKITYDTKLVGITLPDRVPYINKLTVGEHLLLERDAKNEYDVNAIRVLDREKNMLGHVEKGFASILSEKLDIGMEYTVTVKEICPKYIDLDVKRNNYDKDILYDFLKYTSPVK